MFIPLQLVLGAPGTELASLKQGAQDPRSPIRQDKIKYSMKFEIQMDFLFSLSCPVQYLAMFCLSTLPMHK